MKHLPYKRVVKGCACAFLFVHGFLGTPDHFKPFLSLLPETVSVYNLLLDGHGKDVGAFSRTCMNRWERQVEQAVKELLDSHERVYIAAHSMGTLFAIDQSISHPGVAGLFLMAVPLKLRLRPKILINSMKVCFGRTDPENPVERAAKNCCSIAPDRNPLHYMGWVPRLVELFSKIYRTKRKLPYMKTPCTVLFSGKDELISPRSVMCFHGHPTVSIKILPNSGHYYYPPRDMELLLSEFRAFIRRTGV